MMALPILYSFRRCPYAMRARMSIVRTQFQVELREVILRDRPEHMMEISPKGTVPVLLLDRWNRHRGEPRNHAACLGLDTV